MSTKNEFVSIDIGDGYYSFNPDDLIYCLFTGHKLAFSEVCVFLHIYGKFNSVSYAKREVIPYYVTIGELAEIFAVSRRSMYTIIKHLTEAKLIFCHNPNGKARRGYVVNNKALNALLHERRDKCTVLNDDDKTRWERIIGKYTSHK